MVVRCSITSYSVVVYPNPVALFNVSQTLRAFVIVMPSYTRFPSRTKLKEHNCFEQSLLPQTTAAFLSVALCGHIGCAKTLCVC
jgi:hypothetical protein